MRQLTNVTFHKNVALINSMFGGRFSWKESARNARAPGAARRQTAALFFSGVSRSGGQERGRPARPNGTRCCGDPERGGRWKTCRAIRRAGRPRSGLGDRHCESPPYFSPVVDDGLARERNRETESVSGARPRRRCAPGVPPGGGCVTSDVARLGSSVRRQQLPARRDAGGTAKRLTAAAGS